MTPFDIYIIGINLGSDTMNKFLNKVKNDDGAANTISFMMIIFVVMVIMFSFIDIGMYFNVKNEVQSAAENGARNVALYGGTSGRLRSQKQATPAKEIVSQSINSKFQNNKSKTVVVNDITCGPESGVQAGDKVFCQVEYTYKGLVGDMGIFFGGETVVKVEGSSVSEVFSQ